MRQSDPTTALAELAPGLTGTKSLSWVLLIPAAFGLAAPVQSQSTSWRSVLDERPFGSDSTVCARVAIRTAGSANAEEYPTEFWRCAYERGWRAIRPRQASAGCTETSLVMVSDLPASVPEARVDSLLSAIKNQFLRHYIPDELSESQKGRVALSMRLSGAGVVQIADVRAVGMWVLNRDVERAFNTGYRVPPALARLSVDSLTAVLVLDDDCIPYRAFVPRSGADTISARTTFTSNQPLFDFQVEKPAALAPGQPAPKYPNQLRAANIEGQVVAKFVVDTAGRADMTTFEVLKSDNDLFTNAVKAVLPTWKFFPAEVGGRRVSQLVQMPFAFSPKRQ